MKTTKKISLAMIFLMASSLALSGISFASATTQSALNGSYTEAIDGQVYEYSLSSSGSGRYDEFYITTSGASSLTATIEFSTRNRVESNDDFDLYYNFGARVSSCGSSTCSGYDQVSWNSGNAPETITVNSPADGTHHFRVQRYSGYGTEYYFFQVTVTGGSGGDQTAPTVSITSPTNGATVSNTVSVTASASDNIGVASVEFRVDGNLKFTDTSSPYAFSWDTTLYSDASHTVSATAYDAAGNSAVDTNTYTVNNGGTPPPTGCGETPRVTGSMPWWNDVADVEVAHAAGCYGGDTTVVILDTGLGSSYTTLFPTGSINTQYSRSYTKSLGYDNIDWNEDATEGHGTSTTATVLGYYVPSSWGMTNNYVMGVAPNAQVIMYRVVYWIGGSVTATAMLNNWAQAINDAVALQNSGALTTSSMVISMSLGYTSTNSALDAAISNARANGVVVSVSAGNDGPNPNTTGYPANHADATSTAAAGWSSLTGSYGVSGIVTDIPEGDFSGLVIADFSSRGKVEITGIGWQLALPTWDGSYQYISGTSFSCPQLSGVYALVFSYYGAIGAAAAEAYILNGAYNSGSMASSTWGAGFVQADGALGL